MTPHEEYRALNSLTELARKEWEAAVCAKYDVPHWQHTSSFNWKGKEDTKIRELYARYERLRKQEGEAFKLSWKASCLERRNASA